jgi:two-component system chemotaxis response regulator CheB
MIPERIVVMGASSGGVTALEQAVAGLPADFPAAVLVVLHMAATQRSLLHLILNRAGTLPATLAVDGEPLAGGRIYVAVPDHHLMVADDRVRVVRGPKENRYRPSVDSLFRSAAYHFGSRAIGVVLSGSLADGSSGLYTIKRTGGVAVVQDPEDAASDSMPLNALRRVDIDYSVPARELGALLSGIVAEAPPREPLDAAHYRNELKLDVDVSAADSAFEKGIMDRAEPSVYTCPECHGVLFRIKEGKVDRFRCHTGHGYTTQALAEELAETCEAALWSAVKTLQESAALLKEAAARLTAAGDAAGAGALATQVHGIHERLDVLRELALGRNARLDGELTGSG